MGLGIDTVGFYIDQATAVSASASVQAGLEGSVSVLGLAGMNVTAGVGASIELSAGLKDPDPADGRIYLDELINYREASIGDALLNALKLEASGEAFGFAKGVVKLLFFKWTVFNERFTIARFDAQLSSDNRAPVVNATSQRAVTGRSPLGRGVLDLLPQNGVLTIDARLPPYVDKRNTVSVADVGAGQIEVTWRGVGQRTYQAGSGPGQVQRIVYIGNEQDDRFYVGKNVMLPVEAHGNGGRDVITVEDASATIFGDAGNDMLTGGSENDTISGGTGDDQIAGGGGNDELHGQAGNDRLEGGQGADQLFGEAGRDVLLGGTGDDQLFGGGENDVIYGGLAQIRSRAATATTSSMANKAQTRSAAARTTTPSSAAPMGTRSMEAAATIRSLATAATRARLAISMATTTPTAPTSWRGSEAWGPMSH